MSDLHDAKVIPFESSPRMDIAAVVRSCPAFGPIADRLPAEGHPLRAACEVVLAALFARRLQDPRLTREQAEAWLRYVEPGQGLIEAELAALRTDPDAKGVYEIWEEAWDLVEHPEVREAARYYAALMARLYRRP